MAAVASLGDDKRRQLFELIASADGAVGLFNTIALLFLKPSVLIGYDFKDGLPSEARTLVVQVPLEPTDRLLPGRYHSVLLALALPHHQRPAFRVPRPAFRPSKVSHYIAAS